MATIEILPVERLTQGRDVFRCEPYRMVLMAQGCVARQDAARLQGSQDQRKPMGDRLRGDYRKCVACPVGEAVRARLDAVGGWP